MYRIRESQKVKSFKKNIEENFLEQIVSALKRTENLFQFAQPSRRKRHTYDFAEDFDAYDVFNVKFFVLFYYNIENYRALFVEIWDNCYNKLEFNYQALLYW